MKPILFALVLAILVASANAYLYIELPSPTLANNSNMTSRTQRVDFKVITDGNISSGITCDSNTNGDSIGWFTTNNTLSTKFLEYDSTTYGVNHWYLHCWTAVDFGATGENITNVFYWYLPTYQSTYSSNDLPAATVSTIAKFFITVASIITIIIVVNLAIWGWNRVKK